MYGSEMPNIKPYAMKTTAAKGGGSQRSSKRNLVHPSVDTNTNGIIKTHNNWTADSRRSSLRKDSLATVNTSNNNSPAPTIKSNGANGSLKKQVRMDLRGDIHSYQEAQRKRETRLRSAHKRREQQAAVSAYFHSWVKQHFCVFSNRQEYGVCSIFKKKMNSVYLSNAHLSAFVYITVS